MRPQANFKKKAKEGNERKEEKEKGRGKKSEVDFLIEVQLEEEHVCLCLVVQQEKVKHAPSRAWLHTQALNGEQVGRWRNGRVQEKGSDK